MEVSIIHTLYMMVGIPGSGKSTYAKQVARAYNATVFSSDSYRMLVLGDETDQSNNQKVFDRLYKDMAFHLENVGNAVFDATNISVKTRAKAFNALGAIKYRKVAICCSTPIDECISRDKDRNRSVGESVILKFVKQFEYPQFFEGFENIYEAEDLLGVTPKEKWETDLGARADAISRMSGYDQNSKYHKYDVLTHSLVLSSFFNESWLNESALFHDIGKTFTENVGEDGYSHYVGHANYSAYVLASNRKMLLLNKSPYFYPDGSHFFDIIFVVNQHMHIRDIIKSEKAIGKYKKLWGKDKFNLMLKFMEFDNKSSGRIVE